MQNVSKLQLVRSVAPADTLISDDDARLQVRRDDTDDDTRIQSIREAVTAYLDGEDGVLGRALVNQTWIETANDFPFGDRYEFELMPLVSVSSVTYYDADNALQTLSSASYSSHNGRYCSYIKLGSNVSWPATYDRDDAIQITAVFGYGAAGTDVPEPIREAARLMIGHYYRHREAVLSGTIAAQLPLGVFSLLRNFIRPHF